MAVFQISTEQQNARLNAMESEAGSACRLRIYSGSIPASCSAPRTGVQLAEIVLGTDWMSDASGGTKSMANLPVSDNSADAAGTAGYFSLLKSDNTTVCWQGDVGATGSGAAMTVDNPVFAAGQAFTVTSFVISDNNG